MNKYHILCVDDEPANLYLLEEVLTEYDITSVKSSAEMFNELEKTLPDIILLDVMMPGMDGLTAAHQLKKNSRFRDIPVIFISVKDAGEDVAKGLNTGADDYIKKPFDNMELSARIKKTLRNTEKKMELYSKATRDNLTGIFNREYFLEHLSLKIRKAQREDLKFSIGIIDIDHFKIINDTWGHQTGDTVLKNLTQFINKSLREYDILARYGGEEFIFFIDGMLKNQTAGILDRIREQTSVTEMDSENHVFISFSCGLSDITEAVNESDIAGSLIKISDRRLYIAKSGGRNTVVPEG